MRTGRYDLLPITLDMEWVRTSGKQIPPGRRPVEGGYEENGGKLYHALGNINGVKVPGKCGEHLVCGSYTLQFSSNPLIYCSFAKGGANIAFGGGEQFCSEYEIL